MADELFLALLSNQVTSSSPNFDCCGNPSQNRVRIVNVSSDAAFIGIAPDLDLANPNLDYVEGIMAAW